MIRLTKAAIPPVLQQNTVAWTQILRDHAAAGTHPTDPEKTRYRHADIKMALVAETSGKCAYCESKLRHIAYGDVEHIVPKSVDLEKTFQWTNLTLACDVCNTNKAAHFGNHEDLVDPYLVEPNLHLNFIGAIVFAKPGSHPGIATESTIKLNRIDLVERRIERLYSLNRQLHLLTEVQDANTKAILRRDIEIHELTEDKEYCAMARTFVSEELRRIDAVNSMPGAAAESANQHVPAS
jgi:5-methylcytosine-specific restriction endonuclease McrA